MTELKRKDEELTTADLAGTHANDRQDKIPPQSELRPGAVRNEQARRNDMPVSTLEAERNREASDPNLLNESGNVPASEAPVTWDSDQQQVSRANPGNGPSPLFSQSDVGDFRSRWSNIQAAFVDEPRKAVENADNLVASLMKKLAEGFARERENLERQWDSGENASTEDLRVAFQRYRSFFDRLLKI